MKRFSFLAAFGKQKVSDGVDSINTFIASIDPEAATDAQIALLTEKRDQYARRLVKGRRSLVKDEAETAAVQSQIDQSQQALRVLQSRHISAPEKDKDAILSQAKKIADKVDELNVELDREKAEDAAAREFVDTIQELYDQMDDMLKKAGSKMQAAQRRMQTSQAKVELSETKMELNSARESFGGLNVALDAMERAAEEAEATVEVNEMNASSSADQSATLVADILAQQAEEANPASDDPFRSL